MLTLIFIFFVRLLFDRLWNTMSIQQQWFESSPYLPHHRSESKHFFQSDSLENCILEYVRLCKPIQVAFNENTTCISGYVLTFNYFT